jgi:CheY-like chemotaxis protein
MNAEQHIVLLVDDEPLVLRALSRALRREAYQILLANSGAEGLALLARHPVDVVVSDMRMPNMDGVTFLRQVREQCPQVARIILTGYAEREMIRRAFEQGDTIEVLNKPWDDEQLKRILRELLEQQEQGGEGALGLHAIISRSGQLPVVPQAYREIRALMEASQEPSLEAIAQAIMREPAITAKILQIANSTFFGQRRRVGTVERAVMVMGLELVRDLVLASSLFSALQTKSCEGFEHQALWRHSMACGLFALRLAQQYGLAA